jgi:hypothetical protein
LIGQLVRPALRNVTRGLVLRFRYDAVSKVARLDIDGQTVSAMARMTSRSVVRENGLLSPHRHLPRSEAAHDGRITTDAPNLMWGTDATQIPTVLDGKVWLFAVVEHWNAEGLG